MNHCELCALATADVLERLRWLDFVDEAELAHALEVGLARTGLAQRAFADRVGCSQSAVSKHRKFPRRVEALPWRIDARIPPSPSAPVSVLERWCAFHVALGGWVPSVQHRIRRRNRPPTSLLRWPRCDVVLSGPGEWRPEWAIEGRRRVTTPGERDRAWNDASSYAWPLGCRPLVVAYELSAQLASADVITPLELLAVVGCVGPPYDPPTKPRQRRPRRRPAGANEFAVMREHLAKPSPQEAQGGPSN